MPATGSCRASLSFPAAGSSPRTGAWPRRARSIAHVEEKLNARVPRPSPNFARALALAAIRETFEETGLAIGVADYGAPENPPPGAWTRFAATGVHPALDAIDFLARAITPPGRPRRFDARFLIVDARFIARRVEGAVHSEAELVELVWTPLDEARNLDLPTITHVALDDLGAGARRRPGQTPAPALLSRDSEANGCASSCSGRSRAAPHAASRTGGNRPASSISAR